METVIQQQVDAEAARVKAAFDDNAKRYPKPEQLVDARAIFPSSATFIPIPGKFQIDRALIIKHWSLLAAYAKRHPELNAGGLPWPKLLSVATTYDGNTRAHVDAALAPVLLQIPAKPDDGKYVREWAQQQVSRIRAIHAFYWCSAYGKWINGLKNNAEASQFVLELFTKFVGGVELTDKQTRAWKGSVCLTATEDENAIAETYENELFTHMKSLVPNKTKVVQDLYDSIVARRNSKRKAVLEAQLEEPEIAPDDIAAASAMSLSSV